MEQQQSMLAERGLILLGGDDDQEETLDEDEQEKRTRAIVSQETANILSGLGRYLKFSEQGRENCAIEYIKTLNA